MYAHFKRSISSIIIMEQIFLEYFGFRLMGTIDEARGKRIYHTTSFYVYKCTIPKKGDLAICHQFFWVQELGSRHPFFKTSLAGFSVLSKKVIKKVSSFSFFPFSQCRNSRQAVGCQVRAQGIYLLNSKNQFSSFLEKLSKAIDRSIPFADGFLLLLKPES